MMLKFLFACLVAINIGFLAFQLGWLDALLPGGREPQRMTNQINADKLRLLSPRPAAPSQTSPAAPVQPAEERGSEVPAAAPESSPVSALPSALAVVHMPAAAATPALPAEPQVPARAAAMSINAACVEIGNLAPADARRFEARLATLTLPSSPVRRETREESSHMVWIPPLPGGKPAAERKVAELRSLGVHDYYLLQDDTPQRNGISLGVFTTESAAKARLAQVGRQGVRSARLIEHRIALVRAAYQIAVQDEATRAALQRISSEFPRHSAAACAA